MDDGNPPSRFKTIGVLGGMGAAATVDFYAEVVRILQSDYAAVQDTDFPHMFIYNLSLDGFDETGFVDEIAVKRQLLAGLKKIEAAGADFVVMPCNTVHHFESDLRKALSIPLISILDAVVTEAAAIGCAKVGLLASDSTRKYRLYETRFVDKNLEFVSATDEEQLLVNRLVLHAIGGKRTESDTREARALVSRLVGDGAGGIVLGCTELPLAIVDADSPVPLINSTRALARAAVRYAREA